MSGFQTVAGDQLKQYIERIERLEEEKAGTAADIRDVFAEAKGNGFDVKVMREVIKLRKLNRDEMDEKEFLLDAYKAALGMIPSFENSPVSSASTAPATFGTKVDVEEDDMEAA